MDTEIRVAVLIEKDRKYLLGQEATKIIYGWFTKKQINQMQHKLSGDWLVDVINSLK